MATLKAQKPVDKGLAQDAEIFKGIRKGGKVFVEFDSAGFTPSLCIPDIEYGIELNAFMAAHINSVTRRAETDKETVVLRCVNLVESFLGAVFYGTRGFQIQFMDARDQEDRLLDRITQNLKNFGTDLDFGDEINRLFTLNFRVY